MPTILKFLIALTLSNIAGSAMASQAPTPTQAPQQQRTEAPVAPAFSLETPASAALTPVEDAPFAATTPVEAEPTPNTAINKKRLRDQAWWPRFNFNFGISKPQTGEKAAHRASFGGERVTLYLIIALVVILVIAWPLQLFPEIIMWIYGGVLVLLLILWLIGLI